MVENRPQSAALCEKSTSEKEYEGVEQTMIESNSLPEQLKDLHNNLSEKPASVLDTNSPVSMYFKTAKDNQILYTAAYGGEIRYLIGDSINVPAQTCAL